MKSSSVKKILKKIKDVKIAVYGDFCLDVYWDMDPNGSEVSVETGLQAESVKKHTYSLGGAGNIVANVAALKPKSIRVIGVVGNDIYGNELKSKLNAIGADTDTLTVQTHNFSTYAYIKKMYGDKEEPRMDFGLNNKRSKQTDTEILKNIKVALKTCDILIFNQQVVGSISNKNFIEEVNRLFKDFDDKIVIVDSRHYNSSFRNVYRKSNEIEIAVLNGVDVKPQDYISFADIKKYGTKISKQYNKPIFVTCGDRGIVTFDATGICEVPGIQLNSKIDTVGAGDTSLSALSCCLAAGVSPQEAAEFANFASAVTIQKLFTTGTASGEEILEISNDPDYNYQPELAGDIRLAKYHKDTEIEICYSNVIAQLGNIKHVVFDHDGTISTQREGWEQIMEPVMIQAVLGDYFETADKMLYDNVRSRVLDFIDKSTGIQTIVQMEGLVKMVDEFNLVPKEAILDKFGYKEIFNTGLMEMVNQRMAKLNSGQLTVHDFTMKGAIGFLYALKEKGVRIYLASGTDKEDVIIEANSLGYADVFDGGIYGSVGDITKYSKKMVIDNIIKKNHLKGNELLVIGDGPVEIKECRKANGIAIGIASDEIRRYGLNRDKRLRLIKAGAQIIIPDFSQTDALIKLIFNKNK
ncbi:MAG: PfkB family carbohydrate kinase [Flavobacteriaceae bacterium]|nr:PfkB family carbohydrate kinase [Flavobacteriaceae bacterium]